jgi:hypothetical protein
VKEALYVRPPLEAGVVEVAGLLELMGLLAGGAAEEAGSTGAAVEVAGG